MLEKSNIWKKLLPCAHYFISGYMLVIISCHYIKCQSKQKH